MAPSSPAEFSNKMFSRTCRVNIIFCITFVFMIAIFSWNRMSARLASPGEQLQQLGTKPGLRDHTVHGQESHMYENSLSTVLADAPSHRVLSRGRRSVLQLASMLKCVTGCSPLAFHGYGCFCGYLGDGAPVDPIDTCCLEHDWCYSATQCPHLSTYLLPYHWNCAAPGIAHCSLTDSASPHHGCAQPLCECDLQFARCISRYPCPGHRAGCHHGGRSLLKDVLTTKAAVHGWRIQNGGLQAATHLMEHILNDEDEDKTVKRKSKKKITLSAGIHQDPFANSFFPSLHASVQVEKDNEETEKKHPDKEIVTEGHRTFFAEKIPVIRKPLPGPHIGSGVAAGADLPANSPDFVQFGNPDVGPTAFGGVSVGPGGAAFGANAGRRPANHNAEDGESFGSFGRPHSSGVGGNPPLSGNPGFPQRAGFPEDATFTENTAPVGGVGSSGNAASASGSSGLPVPRTPDAAEGVGFQKPFSFEQSEVSGLQRQHGSERAGNGKKRQIIEVKESSSSSAAIQGKEGEKEALESKDAPKFDKVFRDDVDVAVYLRSSPRPAANRLTGLSMGWFTKYYDSISKIVNRNFTTTLEHSSPETRATKLDNQKRGDSVLEASSSAITSSSTDSPRKNITSKSLRILRLRDTI